MDEQLLKAILSSSDNAIKTLDEKDRKKLVEEDRLTITSNFIFDAVCTSLTKLLCHPVSKEAYQRYSVRLHILETLREWCRIQPDFQHCQAFTRKQKTLELLANVLNKYLTDDLLFDSENEEYVVQFTSALISLLPDKPSFKPYVEKLLVKLSKSELSIDGERLLYYAISENAPFTISLDTLEEIYVSQKQRLIEEPLLNQFQSKYVDLNKSSDHCTNVCSIDRLLEVIANSSRLFSHVCHLLKDLLVYLDYAPTVLEFIAFVLNAVTNNCRRNNKDILDLYPKDLQSLVILLRIEPSEYSERSREATLKKLGAIFFKNKDSLIILLSHFPKWLASFECYFSEQMYL